MLCNIYTIMVLRENGTFSPSTEATEVVRCQLLLIVWLMVEAVD